MINVKDFKKDFENKWLAESIIESLITIDRKDPAALEHILSYLEWIKANAVREQGRGGQCKIIKFETIS